MQVRDITGMGDLVSVIGFGGGAISGEGGGYGFGAISEKDAIELLRRALDAGINLFDTAPIYGFGTSELRIGKAFHERRQDVFLVSKCGVTWHENRRVNMDNSPIIAARMLDESLQRLAVDYIDLYMIHWPSDLVDIRQPMEVLVRAREAGKIRHIGLCNTYSEDLRKARSIGPITTVQSEYNLFNRSAATELFPELLTHDAKFMSYGTLDKGILTGRVTVDRKFDAHDARATAPWWKRADRAPKYRAMQVLLPWLQEREVSPLALAVGFALADPVVATALCGARNEEQLLGLCQAAEQLPDGDLLREAQTLMDQALASEV